MLLEVRTTVEKFMYFMVLPDQSQYLHDNFSLPFFYANKKNIFKMGVLKLDCHMPFY